MTWYNPLSWFDTADKAADAGLSIIDGVKSGIDMLVLTPEEEIVYKQKGMELYLEHQKLNMDQNSERSKARREIAKAIVYYVLFMSTATCIIWRFDSEWATFIKDLMVEWKIGFAFVAVIVFYFGYYGAAKIAEKIKK